MKANWKILLPGARPEDFVNEPDPQAAIRDRLRIALNGGSDILDIEIVAEWLAEDVRKLQEK